jgi:protein TonB
MPALATLPGIDLNDRQTRTLLACIVASLLLHAVLLFLLPGMREGRPAASASTVLMARIAPRSEFPERPELRPEARPSVRPEVRPVPVSPPPKPEAPRPVLTAPSPVAPAAPTVAAPPVPAAPAPAPAVPSAPASPPVSSPPPPAAAPAPTPAAPAPRAADSAAAPAQNEGVDQGTLDRFRMEILAATRRYRRYPAQAMEKGWQGRVEIRLAIGANGVTQSYVIRTSSGFPLLDETALDMVKKGRPLVQVPPSLRGREFTVDVPVVFDLKSG